MWDTKNIVVSHDYKINAKGMRYTQVSYECGIKYKKYVRGEQ